MLVRLDEKICRADGLGKWPMESIPNHQWQLRLSWDFTVSHGIPSIFMETAHGISSISPFNKFVEASMKALSRWYLCYGAS